MWLIGIVPPIFLICFNSSTPLNWAMTLSLVLQTQLSQEFMVKRSRHDLHGDNMECTLSAVFEIHRQRRFRRDLSSLALVQLFLCTLRIMTYHLLGKWQWPCVCPLPTPANLPQSPSALLLRVWPENQQNHHHLWVAARWPACMLNFEKCCCGEFV